MTKLRTSLNELSKGDVFLDNQKITGVTGMTFDARSNEHPVLILQIRADAEIEADVEVHVAASEEDIRELLLEILEDIDPDEMWAEVMESYGMDFEEDDSETMPARFVRRLKEAVRGPDGFTQESSGQVPS